MIAQIHHVIVVHALMEKIRSHVNVMLDILVNYVKHKSMNVNRIHVNLADDVKILSVVIVVTAFRAHQEKIVKLM